MSYIEDFNNITDAGDSLYFKTKYSAAESFYRSALSIAEKNGDRFYIFYAKLRLAMTYSFNFKAQQAVSGFLWCLDNFDDELINDGRLVKGNKPIKLVIEASKRFPEFAAYSNISRDMFTEMFELLEKVYVKSNIGLRTFYNTKINAALYYGLFVEEADNLYKKWLVSDTTYYDNDPALEKNMMVNYYIYKRDYKKALMTLDEMHQKNLKTSIIPEVTYSSLLIPLAKMNEWKLADEYQRRSQKKIAKDFYVCDLTRHIEYVSHRNYRNAIALYNDAVWRFENLTDDYDVLYYYACSSSLFNTLMKRGLKTVGINYSKLSEFYMASGTYKIQALRDCFEGKWEACASAFDSRNGNDFITSQIKETFMSLPI